MAQQFNLIPRRTRRAHRAVADQFRVVVPDISLLGDTVQKIAAHEIKREIDKGNPPQNLIVDNRDNKPFNKADYRVTAIFANSDDIAEAAETAIITLKALTRTLMGHALGSYQIWVSHSFKDSGTLAHNGTPNLTTLKSIAATLPLKQGRLIIVGPLTDYGRKLYWNPASKRTLKGRARKVAAYDADSGKTNLLAGRRSTNMRDLAVPRIKRRHKGVVVVGRWVKQRNLNGDDRWPGIAIGLKTKGRTR